MHFLKGGELSIVTKNFVFQPFAYYAFEKNLTSVNEIIELNSQEKYRGIILNSRSVHQIVKYCCIPYSAMTLFLPLLWTAWIIWNVGDKLYSHRDSMFSVSAVLFFPSCTGIFHRAKKMCILPACCLRLFSVWLYEKCSDIYRTFIKESVVGN